MHFMMFRLCASMAFNQGWLPSRLDYTPARKCSKQLPIHNAHPGKIKETGWQTYRTNGAIRLRMLQVGSLTCCTGILLIFCQLNGSGFSTKGFNFQKNASKAHASPAQTVPPLDTLTALFFAINTLAPPCSSVFFKVSTMYSPFEY